MRVLVCGGRDYRDRHHVNEVLDALHRDSGPITCIITGGARGADALAEKWASDHKIEVDIFIAPWDRYGKAAGPIRNSTMLSDGQPDVVVAFPGGRGTADMISKALAARKRTVVVG